MDYKVILSPKAVIDLEDIVRYIAQNNPESAKKLGQGLIEKAKELSKFPLKGKKVPEFDDPDIRQLIFLPYRIIYMVEKDKNQINISRFWHSSRNLIDNM